MRITKYGHCCLLVEEGGLRILTDPGAFSKEQDSVTGIDVVLITHEHFDHCHVPSVQAVLKNNPGVVVITNAAVAALLRKEGIDAQIVEHGQHFIQGDVRFEARGTEHAPLHSSLPTIPNTGYFIGDRLFYPGDAFTHPGRPVDVLALPIAGPWMKFSEAVEYAVTLKPSVAFPVHEAILVRDFLTPQYEKVLGGLGVQFVGLKAGETKEF